MVFPSYLIVPEHLRNAACSFRSDSLYWTVSKMPPTATMVMVTPAAFTYRLVKFTKLASTHQACSLPSQGPCSCAAAHLALTPIVASVACSGGGRHHADASGRGQVDHDSGSVPGHGRIPGAQGGDLHPAAQPGPHFWHQGRRSRRRLQPGVA